MNKKNCLFGIIIIVLSTVMFSCNKESESKISKNFETESHNMSLNCMTCHVSGGAGEGIFQAAGTVYNADLTATSPNGTVKLYSATNAGGNLVATIEVDANGNFYTTDKIDFTGGLYPTVTGTSGNSKNMVSASMTGQCNTCHAGTSKIWVN